MIKVPLAEKLANRKDEDSMCPTMTFKERLMGFCICCVVGFALSIISVLSFLTKKRDVKVFAVIYTLGNIVNLSGTAFLSGCSNQWKKMTKDTRLLATIIFFLSMAGTLCAAFLLPEGGPQRLAIILAIAIQFCAFFWYSLTFIPFGRRIFKSMCKSCCNSCMEEMK